MLRALRAVVAVSVVMLALDLVWLGLVAKEVYEVQLGDLQAPDVNTLAAGLFYAMYAGVTALWAAVPAKDVGDAARRGAGLGFVAYATYELTNWAVIRDWPAALVPLDIGWGVLLTGVSAVVGRLAAR